MTYLHYLNAFLYAKGVLYVYNYVHYVCYDSLYIFWIVGRAQTFSTLVVAKKILG